MLMTILTNAYLAIAAFAAAQIADVMTTSAAIRSGRGREANPVIRWVMQHTGRAWPIVKLAITTGSAVVILLYAEPLWLWPVTLLTGAVAWSNSRL